jgi:peptidyl-prolyl cis-trans isomerase C
VRAAPGPARHTMRATIVVPIVLAIVPAAVPAPAAQRAMASHAQAAPPSREVARVNGAVLTSDRLAAVLDALIPQESFHRSVDPARMNALREKALRLLVDEELQFQSGVRAGIVIPAAEIADGVRRAAARYPSRAAFAEALRQAGATMADVRRELRRTLTIQKVRERNVAAKCQVSDVDAQRYYTANPDRFVVPEQLHVFAITIGVDPSASTEQWADARARAERILERIRAGAQFEAMAQEYSTDPSRTRGGDMGLVHRGSLNDEFEGAVQAMTTGEVSGVIRTIYGFHIVRLAEVRPPRTQAYADAAADIRRDLTATRCAELHESWLAALRSSASIELR